MSADRVALVTGANRGLGRAVAAALAAEGTTVWLAVRDRQAGEDAAATIGPRAKVVEADLDHPERLADLPSQTGPIDILVNNAGLARTGNMLDDPEGFATQMRVMVHAPYELIRLYAPGMAERNWGRIVNVSSMAGSFGAGLHGPHAYGVEARHIHGPSECRPNCNRCPIQARPPRPWRVTAARPSLV